MINRYRDRLNLESINIVKRLWLIIVALVIAFFIEAAFCSLGAIPRLPPMPPGAISNLKVVSPKFGEQIESWGQPMVYWTKMTPAQLAQLPLMRPKMMFQAPFATAIVTNPTLQKIILAWNYPTAQMPLVQFELWYATDLSGPHPPLQHYDSVPLGFTLSLTTRTNIVSILSNLPAQFFIVRAQDLATGVYSYWNQASRIPATNSAMTVSLVSPPDGATISGNVAVTAVIGTTAFYVDCINGNDANSGLSASTAWKTPQWTKVGTNGVVNVINPVPPKDLSRYSPPVTQFSLALDVANFNFFRIVGDSFNSIPVLDRAANRAVLFSYTATGATNYLPLTNTTWTDIGVAVSMDVVSNRLVIAGIDGVPSIEPAAQVYNLSVFGGLPRSGILASEFVVGTPYPDDTTSVITTGWLSNGGAVVFSYPVGIGCHGIGVYYLRPNGVWTNLNGVSSIDRTNLPVQINAANLRCAEDPLNHTVWMFMTLDTSWSVYAANFRADDTGLYLLRSGILINYFSTNGVFADDSMTIYGEFPTAEPVKTATGVLLAYPSSQWRTYPSTPNYYGNTPMVLTLISNNWTKALVTLTTNSFIDRQGGCVQSVLPNGTVVLTYQESDTNTFNSGTAPLYQQDIYGSTQATPVQIGNLHTGGGQPFIASATSRDVAWKDTNGTWRLTIK